MITAACIHNGDIQTCYRRGGPAFAIWAACGVPVYCDFLVPGSFRWPSRLMVLVACPTSSPMVDWVRVLASRPDCAVGVDVPFPIFVPDAIVAVHPEQGAAAMAFWTDPIRRGRALTAIQSADFVTTSQYSWDGAPDWLPQLRALNPRTGVLPDTIDLDSTVTFGQRLAAMWSAAIERKNGGKAWMPHELVSR